MNKRGQVILGGSILLFGLLWLVAELVHVNLWVVCWPSAIILFGVWLLAQPNYSSPDQPTNIILLGNLKRSGSWPVHTQDIWLGIGDMDLDFTQADIPAGDSTIHFYSLINDVDLTLPADVGVSFRFSAAISDANLAGRKEECFFRTLEYTSPDYAANERRLHIEGYCLISDCSLLIHPAL